MTVYFIIDVYVSNHLHIDLCRSLFRFGCVECLIETDLNGPYVGDYFGWPIQCIKYCLPINGTKPTAFVNVYLGSLLKNEIKGRNLFVFNIS